jgi:CRP-like cAMP-binding protein
MSYCFSSQFSAQTGFGSNGILASLSPSTWLAVESQLQQVDLQIGTHLHEVGLPFRHVYFPTTSVISLVSPLSDGNGAEAAVVGSEGVVGLSACMGAAHAPDTALVQAAGRAWRMPAASFAQLTWRHEDLMRPVLRYGQALMTHMAQTSACNCRHKLEQRMCRWILCMSDRQADEEILVTHERMAAMLGVRREGVTTAATRLQALGVIRYSRGRLRVVDRAGLEATSCECHAVLRAAHESLMDEFEAKDRSWPLSALRSGSEGNVRSIAPYRNAARPALAVHGV